MSREQIAKWKPKWEYDGAEGMYLALTDAPDGRLFGAFAGRDENGRWWGGAGSYLDEPETWETVRDKVSLRAAKSAATRAAKKLNAGETGGYR